MAEYFVDGRRLSLEARSIGAGGEASVHAIQGDRLHAAKLYSSISPNRQFDGRDPREASNRTRKLGKLIEMGPPSAASSDSFVWPRQIVVDERRDVAGFTMRRIDTRVWISLGGVFNRAHPVWREIGFTRGQLTRICLAVVEIFEACEKAGVVYADVKEDNFRVNKSTLGCCVIDCDSIYVEPGPLGCAVGVDEWQAPEILRQTVPLYERRRDARSARFSMALLLFRVLAEQHPFQTVGDAAPAENIKAGRCVFGANASHVFTTESEVVASIPKDLRDLFERAFVDGLSAQAARPSPAEWRDALRRHIDSRASDKTLAMSRNRSRATVPTRVGSVVTSAPSSSVPAIAVVARAQPIVRPSAAAAWLGPITRVLGMSTAGAASFGTIRYGISASFSPQGTTELQSVTFQHVMNTEGYWVAFVLLAVFVATTVTLSLLALRR